MISEREFRVAVGKRLLQLRKAMGKSQAELGTKLGVGDTAVSMYEKGERALDPYDAVKLKVAYGAPLEWLYGGDESVIPPALAEKFSKPASNQRRPNRPASAGRQPKIRKVALPA